MTRKYRLDVLAYKAWLAEQTNDNHFMQDDVVTLSQFQLKSDDGSVTVRDEGGWTVSIPPQFLTPIIEA